MESIILRFAARCEAAGRDYNEDNFLLDDNLNDDTWGFRTDEVVPLEGKGALLVVCDGMGGMNAGEVASAIAVDTIKKWFTHDKLTPSVIASPKSIQRYIYDAIQAADAAIKADSKNNPEHEGMGTTIVLTWLINGKIYVGWCGDSRAYRFNPDNGLERLSHDHSYVQELVDAGKLSEDLAIVHPNSNIITRSLGDPRGKAIPEVQEYELYKNDVILLCSDGLCGTLRDSEIEYVLRQPYNTLQSYRDELWKADELAGWHDNVTILLAQVDGDALAYPTNASFKPTHSAELRATNNRLKIIIALLIAIIVLGLIGLFCFLRQPKQVPEPQPQEVLVGEPVEPQVHEPSVEEPFAEDDSAVVEEIELSDVSTPSR